MEATRKYGRDEREPRVAPTGEDATATVSDDSRRVVDPRVPFERGEVLGRYLVLDPLGAGGMGIVLAAYDSTLDRRVALKLLHRDASSNPENHARLLREAQALAKLSHPGVVSVYDVGELRGQVFIAMEFIDGPNLRGWLRENEPSAGIVLSFFRRAGRALQAAHDAGIVHRDFKPDNVLIDSEGRPHVTDFGLALEADPVDGFIDSSDALSGLGPRLTQSGVIMGTPAYMSIEQHGGGPPDHRSDQFSFCVALFEALYGIRPFSGANARELCNSIRRAELPPPLPGRTVSRRIHRAILRGLSPNPEDRYPSMRAMVRAITPPARDRKTWALGGIAGLAAGAGLVGMLPGGEEPCSAFDRRINDVYSENHKHELLAAFTATGVPYAQASFDTTADALDAYANQWVKAATEACTATERGEQSDEMLDLRMHCLDRGLDSLAAMVDVLAQADARGVQSATRVSTKLQDLALCADLETLPRLALLPANPAQESDAKRLLPLLTRARTLLIVDRDEDAQALLAEHEAQLDASTYPMVKALHEQARGRLFFNQEKPEQAARHLEAAHILALEHGLDAIGSRTAKILAVIHTRAGDRPRAVRWFNTAHALARATGSPRIEASVLSTAADLYESIGELDKAVDMTRHAVELVDGDTDYPARARVELLLSHSAVLHHRDGGDAGLAQLEEARDIVRILDGEGPVLMKLEYELGIRAGLRGDRNAALRHTQRTVELSKVLFGPTSRNTAGMLANLAVHLDHLGRFHEALETLERADALLAAHEGETDERRAPVVANMATVLLSLDRTAEARDKSIEAERLGKTASSHTELTCVIFAVRATVERHSGNTQVARDYAERSLEIATSFFGDSHYRTRDALTSLAHVALDQGEHGEARRLAQRAYEIETKVRRDRGSTALVLGRALWQGDDVSEADQRRARQLVRSAVEDLKDEPAAWRELRAAQSWLGQHDQASAPGGTTAPR